MGVQKVPSLNEHVPSQLSASSILAAKAAVDFGETVEQVLIKYGKRITDEQFVVNRIAQSTIDIYGMFVVLSRASRSINLKYSSAEHEANLANLFCYEVTHSLYMYLFRLQDFFTFYVKNN